ncbi:MAG: carboxypeptidase-like regulatory domain-containing protein [Chitinophagales bacterium]
MKKILLFCWLLSAITVFLNAKNNGKEEGLLNKKVTVNQSNVSIEEVLKELSKRYNIRFSYSKNLVAVEQKVDIDFKNKPLRLVLEELLQSIDADYKILGKRIILKPLPKKNIPTSTPKTPAKKAILKQTIRGRVIDQSTQLPIVGANVVVKDSQPFMGASTDLEGNFRFPDIAVGRHTLLVSYIGYEGKTLSNVLIGTGKELVLEVGLEESLNELDVIEVNASAQKAKPINEMALISAWSVSVEETKRFAAGVSDPARTVTAYAGVMSNGDLEENAVIIRGNSPRGVLWRLEGVEIPNPNHFTSEGSSNGAIGILSTNVIGKSDFYTGAFPSEFGNALSGVFDLQLRNGNNEKREYTLQLGMLGLEAAMEGPLVEKGGASYLVNYRYSTLAMLNHLGINIGGNGDETSYQDVAFKFHFPNQKGYFSLFGIGGVSSHWEQFERIEDNENEKMGIVGLSNLHIFNEKTYLKTSLSLSGTKIKDLEKVSIEVPTANYDENLKKTFGKAKVALNSKINSQQSIETGLIYTHWWYNFNTRIKNDLSEPPYDDFMLFKSKETTTMLQAYGSWKYRLAKNWTMVSGLHALYFGLNGKVSVEPRASLQWQYNEQSKLSFGYGLHSRIESLEYYLANYTLPDGSLVQQNHDLDLTKSHHLVLGYDHYFSPKLHLKVETYYQKIFNAPVSEDPSSIFSALILEQGLTNRSLLNDGKGTNYGLEFTLERFFADNYYFLTNASLFQSSYKSSDGVRRKTPFDSGRNFNVLVGKELVIGSNQQNILGLNLRGTWSGGKRYTPIDLEYSRLYKEEVRDFAHAYERIMPDYKRLDVQLSYRHNKRKLTVEWRLDLLNVTGNRNILQKYYDVESQQIVDYKGNSIVPVLSWRCEF